MKCLFLSGAPFLTELLPFLLLLWLLFSLFLDVKEKVAILILIEQTLNEGRFRDRALHNYEVSPP